VDRLSSTPSRAALGLAIERLVLSVLLEQDHRQQARVGRERAALIGPQRAALHSTDADRSGFSIPVQIAGRSRLFRCPCLPGMAKLQAPSQNGIDPQSPANTCKFNPRAGRPISIKLQTARSISGSRKTYVFDPVEPWLADLQQLGI
jgi:hypothetical protein